MFTPLGRRRSMRHPVHGEVRVAMTTPGWNLALVDVSAGGCLIRTPQPLPLDESFDFLFASADGRWTTRLTARSVHSGRRLLPAGAWSHVTGLAFEGAGDAETACRIEMILGQVTCTGLAALDPAR